MKSDLIYVDQRLVVINKASGISLATRRSHPFDAIERLLESVEPKERDRWGLAPQDLLLVHRLDSGTTGLVLLARDAQSHRKLARAFQERIVKKSYLALVWGHPRPPDGRLDWPIGPDRGDRRRMRPDPSGRPAVTLYRTLQRGPYVSLLVLHPETGRTHQLRVHLGKAGHWIVGDDLYAGPRHHAVRDARRRALLNPPHLLLHAWKLDLPQSCTSGATSFEAPLPPAFRSALDGLGMGAAIEPR